MTQFAVTCYNERMVVGGYSNMYKNIITIIIIIIFIPQGQLDKDMMMMMICRLQSYM